MLRQFLSDSEVTLAPMGSVVLPTEIPGHLRQRSTSPCILFGDSVHVDPQGPDDDRTSAPDPNKLIGMSTKLRSYSFGPANAISTERLTRWWVAD
jgi:hypothetical protein